MIKPCMYFDLLAQIVDCGHNSTEVQIWIASQQKASYLKFQLAIN